MRKGCGEVWRVVWALIRGSVKRVVGDERNTIRKRNKTSIQDKKTDGQLRKRRDKLYSMSEASKQDWVGR